MTRTEFLNLMRSLLSAAERGDRVDAAEEYRRATDEVRASGLLRDERLKSLFLDMEFLLLEEGTTTPEEVRRDLAEMGEGKM